MSNLSRRTVTLGKTQSDYIDAKVASGDFVSASEVVRAALAALAERDAVVERWLATEITPVYEAAMADPSRLKSSKDTFDELREHIAIKTGKIAA